MSKKVWIAGTSVAAVLIAIVAGVLWLRSGPSNVVRFAPPVGDTQQYRIGLRVGLAPGESVFDRSVVLHSVVRYRVADRRDGQTTVHVEPRYMVGQSGHRTLFDSTRAEADETIVAAMRDGFDVTIGENGDTEFKPSNKQAWDRLVEDGGVSRLEQLQQQLNAPGVMSALPAQVGASTTTGGFQTLPRIKLTVTEVRPDSIVVAIDRAADAQPVRVPIVPGSDEAITMTLDALKGRMRIDRSTGWIRSLALVADQTGEKDGKRIPLHLDLSMQALDDNPAAGDRNNSMSRFEYIAMQAGDEDDDRPGYRLKLPESKDDIPADAKDQKITNPKQLFASKGAMFKVDARDHELLLRAPYDLKKNQAAGHLALADLTLTDANGKTLELPMVMDEMRLGLAGDKIGTRVTLRPLGWGAADLSAIHGVKAVFTRRGLGPQTHTSIELADHPTELRRGDAVARAIPVEGKPHQWRVELANGQGQFFVDHSQAYEGLEVRSSDARYGERLVPAEVGMIDRISQPLAERVQYSVKGEATRFPLAYIRYHDTLERLPVTFTDEERRYRDHSAPPPDLHHIFGLPDVPQKPIALDDVAPRDAALHRLRLRLPVGVGEACHLKAKAPDLNGHALVWQHRDSSRPQGGDDAPDETTATQDWELTTDDGERHYFYNTTVDTTLHCPGQPRWQRSDYQHGDTPWLVKIADATGQPVDPDTPAATFFRQFRFVDDRGTPLRPMRLDAQPGDHLGSWHDEAEKTTLADYLADDGTVRFWGRVAGVQTIRFSGEPIDKHWHTEFGDYE
ncbi:hypothetical protein [Salinisphaera hydrothermalis]|uniref:hypothetical protein n=1 Tax=Salinisphaera hydrothermalis TaxID=563188 RepID=UPI00333F6199